MEKIFGMGNALVDILAVLPDNSMLEKMQLPEGSMQLVDKDKYLYIKNIIEEMKTKTATGGSAGNVTKALASLGASPVFVGKVGNDDLGKFFLKDSRKHGVLPHFLEGDEATGVALTFISPSGERTFATYLGAAATMLPEKLGRNARGHGCAKNRAFREPLPLTRFVQWMYQLQFIFAVQCFGDGAGGRTDAAETVVRKVRTVCRIDANHVFLLWGTKKAPHRMLFIILSLREQFLGSPLDLLFDQPQHFIGQIIPRMLFEFEIQQMPQAFLMRSRQNRLCLRDIIVVGSRQQRIRIILQRLFGGEIVLCRIVKQRISVVKQRRGRCDLIGFVVDEKAEISEMPIRVEDQCIQHDHIVQRFFEVGAERFAVFANSAHSPR